MSDESDPNVVSGRHNTITESSEAGAAALKSGRPILAPSRLFLLLVVVLCIAISFPAAMVVERLQDTFGIPAEYDKYSQPPPEILVPMMAAARSAQRKNAALGLGTCGMLLCCALGFCLGLETRSIRSGVVGALDGLVVGGVAGAIGGVGNAFLFQRFTESGVDEMYQAMVIHAPAWVLIGLAAGSTASIVNRSWSSACRILMAGGGGGWVSAAVFPILCLQSFPDAHPALLFPDKFGSLVLWIGLSYALIAFAVIRASRGRLERGVPAKVATATPQ